MAKNPLDQVEGGLKRCAKCGFVKPLSEFKKNAARHDGVQTYCALCHRRYVAERTDYADLYAKNAEKMRADSLSRYWRDPGKIRAKRLRMNRDADEYARHKQRVMDRAKIVKDAVFAAYGGYVCACCGERNPVFMTIDHIHGCGHEQRKKHGLGGSFYAWLRRKGFPPGFQVLCFNCNLGRAKNGGVCPHQV